MYKDNFKENVVTFGDVFEIVLEAIEDAAMKNDVEFDGSAFKARCRGGKYV